MNIENDIPDYAMVPAKQLEEKVLEPISNNAIYTPIEVTNVSEGQKIIFTIEEDILVPDIKPDLKEIFIMEGNCSLAVRELNDHIKEDEYINVSGEILLQTLYYPEKPVSHCPLVSIETRIPFKEQCKFQKAGKIILTSYIDQVEYMIINERKYRIKATVIVSTMEYNNVTLDIFDGLKNDTLHVCKQKATFSTLHLHKKDILSIKEYISPIGDTTLGSLLYKDIHVVENYKQVTGDKIIINGFICTNILYCDKSSNCDVSPCDNIYQLQEKVEFTQFIPLQHMSNFSYCNTTFDSSGLKLKICTHEDGNEIIQLEGDLITYVDLYKQVEKEIITDGYHNVKDFVFNTENIEINSLVGSSISESSVREIFVPKALPCDIDSILFTCGSIIKCDHRREQGKIITEGIILAKIICQLADENCKIITIKEEIPYRHSSSIGDLSSGDSFNQEVILKDFWSEKINGKQLEFNANITSQTDLFKKTTFKLLTNPSFEISKEKEYISPLIIYCCKQRDNLWNIAKNFKTSKESIISINNLEKEDLMEGQKLLIMR